VRRCRLDASSSGEGQVVGSFEHDPSGSIKDDGFFD
jgi:hypothetical protein